MRHFFCAGFFGYIFIEPQGIISPAAATYFAYSAKHPHQHQGAFVAFESPCSERAIQVKIPAWGSGVNSGGLLLPNT